MSSNLIMVRLNVGAHNSGASVTCVSRASPILIMTDNRASCAQDRLRHISSHSVSAPGKHPSERRLPVAPSYSAIIRLLQLVCWPANASVNPSSSPGALG